MPMIMNQCLCLISVLGMRPDVLVSLGIIHDRCDIFRIYKNKGADQLLISAFVFSTWIVDLRLLSKFKISSL